MPPAIGAIYSAMPLYEASNPLLPANCIALIMVKHSIENKITRLKNYKIKRLKHYTIHS
jgi:hypothetical protein